MAPQGRSDARGASRVKLLLALHALLGLYSLSDVSSKLAAGQSFLSWGFIVCYGVIIAILGTYAIAWQQIIKRMPLSSAYANRAITVVWGIFWGRVIFGEAITPGKVVGAAMVIAGVVLFARLDARDEEADGATATGDGAGGRGDAA